MPKKPKTGRAALPKRFQPLFDQAQTETAIRYGSQQDALGAILQQAARDYGRQSAAQTTAGQSVLGSLQRAPRQLTQAYTDAGLTPSLLGQISNSPTGQRLAGELASGQAGIQQQFTGAQAGQQYLQQHLYDEYRDDVGQIGGQITSLGKEKGLFQSSLLDQLISGDREQRRKINAELRKQAHDDEQAILDRASTTGNALIGQGVTPIINEDGSVTLGDPIPGGKADPNAPGNKPPKPKWLDQGGQNAAQSTISKAFAQAKRLKREGRSRSEAARLLTEGRPGQQVVDAKGNKVNIPGVESYEQLYASVALDLAFDDHISKRNVQELHAKRIKVKPLGYKTRVPPKPSAGLGRGTGNPASAPYTGLG